MQITLKNFKYYPELSEDSNCFTAAMCINGVLTAYVKDDGHGGCIDFDPAGRTQIQREENRRALQAAEEWVKKNVPPETYTITLELPPASMIDSVRAEGMYDELGLKAGTQSTGVLEPTLESYIGDLAGALIQEWADKKQAAAYRRQCKTRTLYRLPHAPGSYYTMNRPYGPRARAAVLAEHPDAIILNDEYGTMLSAEEEERRERKVIEAARLAQYKKECKRNTLFKTPDQKPGTYMRIPYLYNPTLRTKLEWQYGRDIEIINDLFLPERPAGSVEVYELYWLAVKEKWTLRMTHIASSQAEARQFKAQSEEGARYFTTDFNEAKEMTHRQ